ncbi:hypothetical protein AM500_12920 [Bacillus sp. FJAT-18017]|uniref:hypothetical protein n=1 Tax=Bacillus sp. FJAT-18017 TaxID=1705566 RepID=UPI0006AE8751|nr:hypothetical protein [Bacillus sp. FJAT-18017]ALC90587.1 hypothetical protein AM500_12920 [Bacillus sp. FJAT-18017]
MSIDEIVRWTLDIISFWLAVQWGYGLVVLVLGRVIVDYYNYGTWEHPQNVLHKLINFLMSFFFGFGPYFYKKFRKYNWLIRKLALIGVLIVGGIAAILVFLAIEAVLKFLFL